MVLGAPQLIMLFMMALSIGVSIARFGEPKRDCYDYGDIFVGPAVALALLWWGGFFT
jgi:hypothetical protein